MAVSRSHHKKAPTQKPTGFFKCEQQGGTQVGGTKSQSVPDQLSGGPMREKVFGKKSMS